jgi:vanillate O-demethylase ferredoxin subunit
MWSASRTAAVGAPAAGGFEVELARSATVVAVPEDRTILEVLREAGVECATSCEAGLCGTCRTRYLAGVPDHRDLVLDDAEHAEYLTICCSRALSARLVLDL